MLVVNFLSLTSPFSMKSPASGKPSFIIGCAKTKDRSLSRLTLRREFARLPIDQRDRAPLQAKNSLHSDL